MVQPSLKKNNEGWNKNKPPTIRRLRIEQIFL